MAPEVGCSHTLVRKGVGSKKPFQETSGNQRDGVGARGFGPQEDKH